MTSLKAARTHTVRASRVRGPETVVSSVEAR